MGRYREFGVEVEEEREDEPWEAHGRFYEHAAASRPEAINLPADLFNFQ